MYKTQVKLRNEAFSAGCRRLAERASYGSLEELAAAGLAELRPLHYYVELERAREVYRAHRLGVAVRRGQWEEFCVDVDKVLESRPWLGEKRAVDFVVSFGRPTRYHFSTNTGRRILAGAFRKEVWYRWL